jgi:hypothetical protein
MGISDLLSSFNWKKTIGAVAPGIATALGGPLAGMAAKVVCESLGLPEGASEKEIEEAVRGMTPEQALKLKEGEQNFAIQMKKMDVDIYKTDQQDRDSARSYAIKQGAAMVNILSFLIISSFILCVYFILFSKMSTVDSALAGTLIGYLSAKAEQVVAYHFGSSAGSKRKTDQQFMEKGAKDVTGR